MAAIRRGNNIYADGSVQTEWDYNGATAPYDYSQNAALAKDQSKNVLILKVVLTATAALASVQINDGGNPAAGVPAVPLIALAVAVDGDTKELTFETPVSAPNGLIVENLVNGVVQLTIGVAR
jgi:hypothetical protein